MNKKGLLIVISGPSGTGKGTVCRELIKKNDCCLSISATTRNPREGEINGKNYFFLTESEFKKEIINNDFLEFAQVYGNYYGTPKAAVFEKLDKGINVILEIDIQGALNVKKSYPQGIFIFLFPPSMEELKKRIIKRGSETPESLKLRFESAASEIKFAPQYNYAVVNDKVGNAVNKIESIIIAEKCNINRFKDKIFASKEEVLNEWFYN